MIVDRNGVKYVRIGRTEFLEKDVKGKSLKKLQKMFRAFPEKIILALSEEVSPKKEPQESSGKKDKK